jgi:hypothetical protein
MGGDPEADTAGRGEKKVGRGEKKVMNCLLTTHPKERLLLEKKYPEDLL